MNIKPANTRVEYSVLIGIDKVPSSGLIKDLNADPEARKRLIKRFDLLDLPKLTADLTVKIVRAGRAVEVTGSMTADVVQKCSVTNEPVPDHIEKDIDVLFTDEAEDHDPGTETFVEPTSVDVEPMTNGVIDLGELLAQNLGIALNPYPRVQGVVFKTDADEGGAPVSASPLAQLIELTKKPKS